MDHFWIFCSSFLTTWWLGDRGTEHSSYESMTMVKFTLYRTNIVSTKIYFSKLGAFVPVEGQKCCSCQRGWRIQLRLFRKGKNILKSWGSFVSWVSRVKWKEHVPRKSQPGLFCACVRTDEWSCAKVKRNFSAPISRCISHPADSQFPTELIHNSNCTIFLTIPTPAGSATLSHTVEKGRPHIIYIGMVLWPTSKAIFCWNFCHKIGTVP